MIPIQVPPRGVDHANRRRLYRSCQDSQAGSNPHERVAISLNGVFTCSRRGNIRAGAALFRIIGSVTSERHSSLRRRLWRRGKRHWEWIARSFLRRGPSQRARRVESRPFSRRFDTPPEIPEQCPFHPFSEARSPAAGLVRKSRVWGILAS